MDVLPQNSQLHRILGNGIDEVQVDLAELEQPFGLVKILKLVRVFVNNCFEVV